MTFLSPLKTQGGKKSLRNLDMWGEKVLKVRTISH